MEKINNLKEIDVGFLINQRVKEMNMEEPRICNFLKCTVKDVREMYDSTSLDSEILLKWSKLLEYDFFRIYTQHLILYSSPGSNKEYKIKNKETSLLPTFRKSLYTKQVIDFILDLIKNGDKTASEIIKDYRIPKTTLYKWIRKYSK